MTGTWSRDSSFSSSLKALTVAVRAAVRAVPERCWERQAEAMVSWKVENCLKT